MAALRADGVQRVWLVTTNDNLAALAPLPAAGWRLAALRPGAIDEARRTLKPSIGEIGEHGIPIRDELELDARALRGRERVAPILRASMLGFLSRFVDSNDRELKRIQPFVDEANELEAEIKALSDEEIRARFPALRDEFRETSSPEEPSDDELHHPDLERRRELAKARRQARTSTRSRTPSTTSCRTSSRWPARRWSGRSGCATSTTS